MRRFRILVAACATSVLVAQGAWAQQPAATPSYAPTVGQEGKDVIWVPTQAILVEQMLDMAQVTPQDYLVDLGSGDGRTVIAAAKRGLRAHGIEFNPDMVELSRRNAAAEGVTERATFAQGDIFQSDFSRANVVTLFLLRTLNERLRPILLEMEPGTRVVSNTFNMGDWTPDQEVGSEVNCTSFCRAYKWIIPAKVGGEWRLGNGTLALTQQYQMLTGTMVLDGRTMNINNGRMQGRQISFTVNGQRFTGEVQDNSIAGQVDGAERWTAQRGG